MCGVEFELESAGPGEPGQRGKRKRRAAHLPRQHMDPSMGFGVEAPFAAAAAAAASTFTTVLESCAASRRRIFKSAFPCTPVCGKLRTAPKHHQPPSLASLRASPGASIDSPALRLQQIKAMASITVTAIKYAAVFLAVISSMAVAANGQAPGPAPPPESGGAGASAVPSILAPAIALVLAFGVARMQW